MKKLYTKVTAVVMAAVVMLTATSVNPLPAEAGNLPETDLEGKWDYGFDANLLSSEAEGAQNVQHLDDYFNVYQFGKPDSAETSVAKKGPVKPSDNNPDSWNSAFSYFTTARHGDWARGGLKATSVENENKSCDKSGYTTLTYKVDTMKDFEAEFEIFPGGYDQILGLTFGAGDPQVFPITLDGNTNNDTGVGIYLTNRTGDDGGTLYVYGAIDSSESAVETTLQYSGQWGNETNYIADYTKSVQGSRFVNAWYFSKGAEIEYKEVSRETPTYKIHVKVSDGKLTITDVGTLSRGNTMTIPLTDKYKGGYVSLYTNTTHYGAFKSFRIKKNSDADKSWYYNFTGSGWNDPERYFTSYFFENAEAEPEAGSVWNGDNIQWFWSDSNTDNPIIPGLHWAFRWSCQDFLRPRHMANTGGAPRYTLATLKERKVQNVEAALGYVTNYTGYGMMIAPEGKVASLENGGIQLYVNGDGSIVISGAIDSTDATWNGEMNKCTVGSNGNSVTGPAYSGYVKPIYESGKDEQNKTSYVLRAKVENGRVTASVEGFEGELSVKLSSNYKGGAFSLFSTGCDQGGIIGCNVIKLEDTKPVEVNATATWELSSDYVAVTLSSDVDGANLTGTIAYDTEKFEYVTELLKEDDMHLNGKTGSASVGSLAFNVAGEKEGDLVTYLFRQITPGLLDVRDFTLNISNAVSTTVLVRGDADANKKVDVKDLVCYKKGKSVTTANMIEINDSADMRKALLGIGTEEYKLAGKKALFLGDSICEAVGDSPSKFGWSGRVGALYGMNTTSVGHGGWMLADHKVNGSYQYGQKPIAGQLDEVTDVASYDYVILQGGVNDVWHSSANPECVIEIGQVTPDGQMSNFNTNTVCGALENLIATAKEKAPDAKIAYIINFKCNEEEGVPAGFHGIGSMVNYVNAAKEVCKKWNVPCLNLYEDETFKEEFNILNHTTDGVHPNAAGYDILVRYIGPWMEELE